MSGILATTWYLSVRLYSDWLGAVVLISTLACFLASRRPTGLVVPGQLLAIVGAPILFITVLLFSKTGMFILKEGHEFGFPIRVGRYPDASDFLATYVALGASYLIARQATRMSLGAVRIVGWIEVAGFASLAAFELSLLGRRIYGG